MKTSLRISLGLVIFVLTLFMMVSSGCTDNARARRFGGTETITVKGGQKVINVTWKESQLWYLTRPARPGETSEVYTFHEKSSMGVMEGTVILRENIGSTDTQTP